MNSIKHKGIRYMGFCIRDILRFTPLMLWGKLTVSIVEGALGVWMPILLAQIFELVPNLDASNILLFQRNVVFLCLCVGIPPLCSLVARGMSVYNDSKKESCYGWRMFEHAQKIKLESLEDPEVLNAFQKANTAYEQASASKMLSALFITTQAALVCISTVFVAGSFSLWLIPGTLLGFLVHLFTNIYSEKHRAAIYRGQSSVRRRLWYLWQQFCRRESVKEMRTMGFHEYMKKLWVETSLRVVQEMQEVELRAVKLGCVAIIIKNACYAANVAIALYLMVNGELAVGEFAACLSAFSLLQAELTRLGDTMGNFFAAYHYVEEYYDFFQTETEETGHEDYRPFQKEIAIKGVHFRYCGGDRDALNCVELNIRKGAQVVIVGVNGSGKTTLSKVLTGAYLAQSGEVLYDEQDVKDIRREELYKDISLVSQDFVHYNFSLGENIFISDLSRRKDEKHLQEIVDSVGLKELVQGIGGIGTLLGKEFGGCELSGGEWQKVAIARGLFKDSPLIVLDEPTSALDPLIEYDILTKFLELTKGRTSVIISHRVGICRAADKVVVMKDGRVVECGTHEALKHAGGEYGRIWREQAKWY